MINKLIETSLKNRFLVILIYFGIIGAGYWALTTTPVDAIPDLTDNQVIVFADWPGRSPQEVEEQVTYVLASNLRGLAGARAVRSQSMFGFAMIYIIFEDSIPIYFARERVLEKLNLIVGHMPPGVIPILGPDATGVGQVYWYTVENRYFCPNHPRPAYENPGKCPIDGAALQMSNLNVAELRSLQDWSIRYALNAVSGVSEVASAGGYVRQYQIDVDPQAMSAYHITLADIVSALSKSNLSIGAKVIEQNKIEHIVRGIGWIKDVQDIENVVIKQMHPDGGISSKMNGGSNGASNTHEKGRTYPVPLYVKNIATVQIGPDFRRGVLEKNGQEAVGGVVVARYGVNTNQVIEEVKKKIAEIEAGLPHGVKIVSFYDRSELVHRAVDTLKESLFEIVVLVTLTHIIFLMHFRSIFIVCLPLPLAILVAFLFMKLFGITSNIMSLAGIAIAIGELVDAGIVITENCFRNLEMKGIDIKHPKFGETILSAAKMVGRPIFFSMLIIILAFVPVFALTGQEGKLFHPLAFTKMFAMIAATIIAVTLVPVLCTLLIRGKLHSEEENIVMRFLRFFYIPVLKFALSHKKLTIAFALTLFIISLCSACGAGTVLLAPIRLPLEFASLVSGTEVLPSVQDEVQDFTGILDSRIKRGLGKEFMPPLDEGDLLFMPITAPNISITGTIEIMKYQDGVLKSFPEVIDVVGKSGRAETPTDPAPLSMFETIVRMKPVEEWPKRAIKESICESIFKDLVWELHKRGALNSFEEVRDKRWKSFMEGLGSELKSFEKELMKVPEKDRYQKKRAFEKRQREDMTLQMSNLNNLEKSLVKKFKKALTLHFDRFTRSKAGDEKALNSIKELLPGVIRDGVVQIINQMFEKHTIADEGVGDLVKGKAPDDLKSLVLNVVERHIKGDLLEAYTKQRLMYDVMDPETTLPGVANLWTQPIINRIDMISTGVRTQVGIKVSGSGNNLLEVLETLERKSNEVSEIVKNVPGATGVYAQRIKGASYLEVKPNDLEIARYGLNRMDVLDMVEAAIGGKHVATTIEGRARYPVLVRYSRSYREDLEAIRRIYIDTPSGLKIPLVQLTKLEIKSGPAEIWSENGFLRAIIYLNVFERAVGTFVDDAKKAVESKVVLPPGYFIEWTGQYEHEMRATSTLIIVFPICFAIIFVLLYITYGSFKEAGHVLLAIPFALTGGFLFQSIMGYNFSVAVWVGYIALFGVAAETGIIMVVYLEEALHKKIEDGVVVTKEVLREAVIEGAALRLRPKVMTVANTLAALIPIMWATGTGIEIMRPLATPVIGGMFSSLIHVLIVTPVIFTLIRERELKKSGKITK